MHTYLGDIPFTLRVRPSGDVQARLGQQLRTVLDEVEFTDGFLVGKMLGDIGTPDARVRPHYLQAALKLRGSTLNGALMAFSLPGRGIGDCLGHWVELTRG